jgi:hypothetical protein
MDPNGIAVDNSGIVYVQVWCGVGRYTPDFQPIGNGWNSCIGMGDVQGNLGIDVLDTPVWIVTVSDVLKFSPEGSFLGRFMANATGTGVHALDDGTVWTSIDHGLVRHYSAEGVILAEWSTVVPGETVSTPFDIDVDESGHVCVTDGRVKIFSSSGAIQDILSPPLGGYFDAEFNGNDTLYVGQAFPDKIVKYARISTPIETESWGKIKARYHLR